MASLFREEAIESFSSNSRIYKGIRAVNIRTGVFVAILVLCTGVFAMWLMFGTVYEKVPVNGVVWPAQSDGEVYAVSSGTMTRAVVSVGNKVKAGDVLAVIPNKEILSKAERGKAEKISNEELERLYDEYDKMSLIRSNIDGIVIYFADENSYINKGERVAEVVPYSENGNNKTLTAFIPAKSGGLVTLGMEAQVMPEFAPREKYGYIKAYVSGISSYPIMGEDIKKNNSKLFLSSLDERESYLRLEITLIPDAQAPSHLKWSNSVSDSIEVVMGTICSAYIIIDKCRPYQCVF